MGTVLQNLGHHSADCDQPHCSSARCCLACTPQRLPHQQWQKMCEDPMGKTSNLREEWNRTSVLASNISGHRRCCPRAIRLDGTACDARHTVRPCESPSLCLPNISLCPPPSDETIRHTQLKCLPGKCVALTSNTEQGKTAQRNPSCSFQHPETFT